MHSVNILVRFGEKTQQNWGEKRLGENILNVFNHYTKLKCYFKPTIITIVYSTKSVKDQNPSHLGKQKRNNNNIIYIKVAELSNISNI